MACTVRPEGQSGGATNQLVRVHPSEAIALSLQDAGGASGTPSVKEKAKLSVVLVVHCRPIGAKMTEDECDKNLQRVAEHNDRQYEVTQEAATDAAFDNSPWEWDISPAQLVLGFAGCHRGGGPYEQGTIRICPSQYRRKYRPESVDERAFQTKGTIQFDRLGGWARGRGWTSGVSAQAAARSS